MTLLYEQELVQNYIDNISEQENFPNKGFIEKFIMDFEILHHVKKLIDCKVRGGMSMPFHFDRTIRRLSIDIDILVNAPMNDVRTEISKIDLTSDGVTLKEDIDFGGNLPMLRYNIAYKSHFSLAGHIDLDIFCENIPELETKTFSKNVDILGFKTKEDVEIFDVGSLIADKLNTLAIGTIGYKIKIPERTPKQVYDLGRLFDGWIAKPPSKPYEKFEGFSTYKASKYNEKFSFKDIVTSIDNHLEKLMDFNNINGLVGDTRTKHGNFKGQYLGSGGYTASQYIEDIFKCMLFCKYILESMKGNLSKSKYIDQFLNDLKTLDQIRNIDDDVNAQKQKRDELTSTFPNITSINTKVFDVTPLTNLYLIKQIKSL